MENERQSTQDARKHRKERGKWHYRPRKSRDDIRSSNNRRLPIICMTALRHGTQAHLLLPKAVAVVGSCSSIVTRRTACKRWVQWIVLLVGYTCTSWRYAAATAAAATITASAATTPARLRPSPPFPRKSTHDVQAPDRHLVPGPGSLMQAHAAGRRFRAAAAAKDVTESPDFFQERRHAIERALNSALLDLSYQPLYDMDLAEGHARGFFRWWDDAYVMLLLGVTFAVVLGMGVWCVIASYK